MANGKAQVLTGVTGDQLAKIHTDHPPATFDVVVTADNGTFTVRITKKKKEN